MVRGGSGRDDVLSELPDSFMHFHYPNVYFSRDKVFIVYSVSPLERKAERRWRVLPIKWLYEP